jgi:hypothetical protein
MYNYNYLAPTGYHNFRPDQTYIRVLHASPDAPAVDVYANGSKIASNLSYRQFTQYLSVPSGSYNIRVFPAGTTQNAVIDTKIKIPGGKIFTVAAVGMLSDIGLLPVEDPIMPMMPGKVYLRFVHLSPDAPAVDVTLPDGMILFKDVSYKEITDYITVNPGTYTINVRPAGTCDIVLYVPNITLMPDRFYTVYAVGLAAGTPPLQVLIPLDGNSYIKF